MISPVADGLPLPAPLATGRGLGESSSRAGHGRPGARRARSFALGCHHRQPDRQDGGSKGGLTGHGEGRPWPRRGRVSAPNGKKIHGRKRVRPPARTGGARRLTLTDADGRLLAVEVHAADIQDRDGAKGVLKRSRRSFPFVQTVFADGAYAGRLVAWARGKPNVTLEIVRRMPWMKGFVVICRRWVVERTDPWIMKCRVLRIALEDEQLASVVEALISIAAIAALLRRWP
jgi:transposase